MLAVLLILPVLAAITAWLLPGDKARPWVLPPLGAAHLIATVAALATRDHPAAGGLGRVSEGLWMRLDAAGSVVLLALSLLFLIVAAYAPGYLRARSERPNRTLVTCACAFLAFASLATASQHLGLMWAAIEAATLCVAPMIYFNHNPRSLEATWKYLMVGGTGIALALLGTFALAYAAIVGGDGQVLTCDGLIAEARHFSQPWLRTAFVLLLVGYGTKMGLAPLHTWKPDAYGETPGLVGALLAGGLTSIAFLAVLRVLRVVEAAGAGPFAHQLLAVMGLLSMAWAGAFMIRQTDIKRMLAYSSVEHMGILALGLALGPVAIPAVLLHVLGNALAKSSLFLSAGNIHRAFASKHIPAVSGAILRVPVSAVLFVVGFLAATGTPPFSLFMSEYGILSTALAGGHWWLAGLFLAFLALVFIGFSLTVVEAVLGETDAPEPPPLHRDSWWTTASPLAGLALVLVLGLWVPGPLRQLFVEAGAASAAPPAAAAVEATP